MIIKKKLENKNVFPGVTGNISGYALEKILGISPHTLRDWRSKNKKRNKLYWLLKSLTDEEISNRLELGNADEEKNTHQIHLVFEKHLNISPSTSRDWSKSRPTLYLLLRSFAEKDLKRQIRIGQKLRKEVDSLIEK